MKKFFLILFLTLGFCIARFASAATLILSPSSGTVTAGQTIKVDIMLDTKSAAIDGVDVFSLRFNSSILEVVDSNLSSSGIQIEAGSLLPVTLTNTVSSGKVQFSQVSSGGTSYTGSGKLATISFKGIANGTSSVTFDFTSGSTSDSNVAGGGVDKLTSVGNGSYTVLGGSNPSPDTTFPTVSISSPLNNVVVSSTINITATASDNVAVVGVQFKLDGINFGNEDTTSPYITSLNTKNLSNGNHTLTATARDMAGNVQVSSITIFQVSNVVSASTVKVVDLCPNLANTQKTIPAGYTVSKGNCVKSAKDSCPNLTGIQSIVPPGFSVEQGKCVAIKGYSETTSQLEEIKKPPVQSVETIQIVNFDNLITRIIDAIVGFFEMIISFFGNIIIVVFDSIASLFYLIGF